MINRELVVIPPEGVSSNKYEKSQVFYRHAENLVLYIVNNDINIKIPKEPCIYSLGLKMAYLDYIVVGTDYKVVNIYLPLTLTKLQAEWFHDNKKLLLLSEIRIVNLVKDEDDKISIEHIERNDTEGNPFNKLYKIIKQKTIKEEKEKVKNYGTKS